jgi:hypothetical protein
MQLVTVAEAIADLGISRPTLYRLLGKNGLTTYSRPGDRAAYVDLDALRQIRLQFEPRRPSASGPDDTAPEAT